jgi:predicted RNA-binding protein with PIN domain
MCVIFLPLRVSGTILRWIKSYYENGPGRENSAAGGNRPGTCAMIPFRPMSCAPAEPGAGGRQGDSGDCLHYNEGMVIVDGNNVMGQRVGWHRDKPAARRRLREEVERLASGGNEPYLLVFDAPGDGPGEGGASEEGIVPFFRVLYARRGSSADELILEQLYHHGGGEQVCVVTSDRALARQARVLGARVVTSGQFRRRLERCAEMSEA